MIKSLICVIFMFFALSVSTSAQSPDQILRAKEIYKQVRCPVCTAQSLSESDTPLSKNLKDKILQEIISGRSDKEILDLLSKTYGDDIRLMPKTEARTVPLWIAPWIVVILGALGIIGVRRIRQPSQQDTPNRSVK